MIMCVLLCYPVSIHMSQLLSTGHPISSLACTDVVINILQLISVHIISIPNFRHIKKISHSSDSILVELCGYAFPFRGKKSFD